MNILQYYALGVCSAVLSFLLDYCLINLDINEAYICVVYYNAYRMVLMGRAIGGIAVG